MIVSETAGVRRSDRADVHDVLAQRVEPLESIAAACEAIVDLVEPAPHLVHVPELGDRLRASRSPAQPPAPTSSSMRASK